MENACTTMRCLAVALKLSSKSQGRCKFNQSSPALKIKRSWSLADQGMPAYDPNYKNPCWWEKEKNADHAHLMCLPYFITPGFPKCGTSDLERRLLAHPLIAAPKKKEPHFLDLEIFLKNMSCETRERQDHPSCQMYTYSKIFFTAATREIVNNTKYRGHGILKKFQRESVALRDEARTEYKYPMITFDASPSTAWENAQWQKIKENQGCEEPYVLNPDLVAKVIPKIKTIMILRNPVDRLLSDYLFFTRENISVQNFHDRSVYFVTQFRSCVKRFSLYFCALTADWNPHKNIQTVRGHIGLYHVFISEWSKRFPWDRILILRTETFAVDIAGQLERVFDFLDIPRLSPEAMTVLSSVPRKNVSPKTKVVGPMLPETRALLTDFYREHNRKLANLLGDDRFLWQSD